jgi:hypothetical protein
LKKSSFRPALLGLAFGLVGLAPSAHAVDFVFRDVSKSGGMTAEQLGAFQTAANYWSSKLTDQVTVYIDIAFDALPQYVLGGTSSTFVSTSYSSIRGALTADATSSIDASAVANLQGGSALSFYATQGDLSSRFDNDGSINNTRLGLTTANAKAMGFSIGTNVASPDANITFATGYAGDFVYTRAGGVPSNKIDFITVAEHEIGHALGFTSGVDDIDFCAGANNVCGLPNTVGRFETDWWYEPLDLFRYSGKGKMDVRVGSPDGTPYLSVDGGATSIESFSTGTNYGDGWQASHFGPASNTLMRAFVRNGEFYDASAADLAAFDAIGWDVAVAAVPEPETYALMLAGLGVVGWAARRRRERMPA